MYASIYFKTISIYLFDKSDESAEAREVAAIFTSDPLVEAAAAAAAGSGVFCSLLQHPSPPPCPSWLSHTLSHLPAHPHTGHSHSAASLRFTELLLEQRREERLHLSYVLSIDCVESSHRGLFENHLREAAEDKTPLWQITNPSMHSLRLNSQAILGISNTIVSSFMLQIPC
jgi:hypothetical protein